MQKDLIITGCSGFVGSNLISRLSTENFNIIGIDSKPPQKKIKEFIQISLKDLELNELKQIFDGKPIIHLAAVSNSKDCENDLLQAFQSNCMDLIKIVEASNQVNSRLIFSSSEWVYPSIKTRNIQVETDEVYMTTGMNTYAATKLLGELIIKRKSKKFDILRFGIIYGKRFPAISAVEDIVFKCVSDEKIQIGSYKTARRFIYVEDIVDGLLQVIKKEPSNEIYNLTGSQLVTLYEIIKICQQILSKSLNVEVKNEIQNIRNPLPDKFYEKFDWNNSTSIQQGVKNLCEYYAKHLSEIQRH